MKRITKISLWKFAILGSLLLAGVQNAIAACAGTLHFKKPDDWPATFYIAMNNLDVPVTSMYYNKATGYYEYDLADAGGENIETSFAIESSKSAPMNYILSNVWNGLSPNDQSYPKNNRNIKCPGAGNDVYVLENPKKANTTLVQNTAPDIKYFYVLVPDDEAWKSTVPMWSGDGTFASGQPLKVDPNMCGWYYAVWMDETMPSNFIIFKDDDVDLEDPIGVDGWGEPLVPFPMDMFFDGYASNKIYFIADPEKVEDLGLASSITEIDPQIEGNCTYKLAAFLYDTDASLHGAFTCDAYPTVASNGCYSASAKYNYTGAGQANTVPCIGVTKGIVNSTLDPATKKPTYNAASGCFVSAEAFNVMFEETAGVNVKHCRDVVFSQTKDGMWEYDSYNEPAGAFTPLNDLATDPTCTGICAIAATPRDGQGNVRYGVGEQGKTPAENGISRLAQTALGPVSDWSAIEPTSGFPYIDLYPVSDGEFGSGTVPNVYDNTTWDLRIKGRNNQMFCFESHANFTYRSGMQFMFRGDDDIWVFIDNKLAVDLGGTHLAAPGYVKLDTLKGSSGTLLTPGQTYDIDIFFCDRRTDMSNVRIKTNMYIQQKTAITSKPKKIAGTAETDYTLCFTKTGDGTCGAAAAGLGENQTFCGDTLAAEINAGHLKASYTLVNGRKNGVNVVPGFENVTTPGVYKGGIDLTNFGIPKIDKSLLNLPGGYYTLFVTIDGKSAKVFSFKTTGEVDVLYKNGNAISVNDSTGEIIQKGKYIVETSAMGGEKIPIYISNIAAGTEGNTDELDIYPDDAAGMEYTLAYNNMMILYKKVVDPATGGEAFMKIHSGEKLTIGPAGIDTVYATVDMENLQAPITPFEISVSGRPNVLTVYFYLPQITFIEKIPEEGETAVSVKGQTPNPDGSYEENWVGSIYEMYLAIVKPNPDGTFSQCLDECSMVHVHMGAETSPKIDFMNEESEIYFVNGYATISIRSLTKYRWDLDPTIHRPATIVAEYNDFVKAVYSPMYFRDPPVPYPVLADVFDARGSLPTLEHAIPAPYFSMQQEYLDGIGDSVAIYYDRRIHKDSLPTRICVMWDSTTAEAHNPYAEKLSTMPKDSAITCNVLTTIDASNIDCSAPSDSGYCTNVIMIGGLKLSEKVKTAGLGAVHSFAEFEDKGKIVKQGFDGKLTDRMAPVPLRAEVRTLKNGDELTDYDSLVVIMSEPIKLVSSSNKKQALDFYLNSAIELDEANRYVSVLGGGSSVVTAQSDPAIGIDAKTGEGRIKYMYLRGRVSPHVGDYVRLSGDISNVLWSDTADTNPAGSKADSLRAASDADYHWNSPTAYNETKRAPSMWVPVLGDPEIAVDEIKYASTSNVPSTEKTPAVSVNGYRTTKTKAEIWAEEGGRPGHLVKADMYALYNGLSPEERASIAPQDVYFFYEVQYYTNLGNFVASKTQKIYCDDNKNTEINPETGERIQYFNGGLCTDAGNDRNFYIGWNMRSDNGRQVGTGAYIVKLRSYVKLGSSGKGAKQESTSVWGVRRSPKPSTEYLKSAGK